MDDHTHKNVDEINSLWNTVKKSYQETSKEIIGHREKKHKEWISQEAWQNIKERRNIKQKLLGIKSERLNEQQKHVYIKKLTNSKTTDPTRQTQIPRRHGDSSGRSST